MPPQAKCPLGTRGQHGWILGKLEVGFEFVKGRFGRLGKPVVLGPQFCSGQELYKRPVLTSVLGTQ